MIPKDPLTAFKVYVAKNFISTLLTNIFIELRYSILISSLEKWGTGDLLVDWQTS